MTDGERLAPRTLVPIDASPLFTCDFDRGEVTDVRHLVTSRAQESGLTGQRLEDFILAVNELITNAVRHGGGRGQLRMWRDETGVTCEVSDAGLGIRDEQIANRERPVPGTAGGWGLWLARQLSDEMLVRTGPDGTTVRVRSAIDVPQQVLGGRAGADDDAHGNDAHGNDVHGDDAGAARGSSPQR